MAWRLSLHELPLPSFPEKEDVTDVTHFIYAWNKPFQQASQVWTPQVIFSCPLHPKWYWFKGEK